MENIWRRLALGMIGAGCGLILYCGSFYMKSYQENRQEEQTYARLRDACLDEKPEMELENTKKTQAAVKKKGISRKPSKKIRESFGISWEKLQKINPEVTGWIEIPGTRISYPVLQGEDDDFYLKHGISGEENPFGCIFLGYGNRKDFLDSHSLVYGHNMEGNQMFASLNRYESPEFLKSCPEFIISTPKRKFIYKIFSVEEADEEGSSFGYGYALGSEEYRSQLETIKRNSIYETGVFPSEERRMVTLVTCNSRLDERIRMAVHGICDRILTEN